MLIKFLSFIQYTTSVPAFHSISSEILQWKFVMLTVTNIVQKSMKNLLISASLTTSTAQTTSVNAIHCATMSNILMNTTDMTNL